MGHRPEAVLRGLLEGEGGDVMGWQQGQGRVPRKEPAAAVPGKDDADKREHEVEAVWDKRETEAGGPEYRVRV